MDLKHRNGKPLADYSQDEREFVLAPVCNEFETDWRLAYGLLNLSEMTAEDAVLRIRQKYAKVQEAVTT